MNVIPGRTWPIRHQSCFRWCWALLGLVRGLAVSPVRDGAVWEAGCQDAPEAGGSFLKAWQEPGAGSGLSCASSGRRAQESPWTGTEGEAGRRQALSGSGWNLPAQSCP